MGDGGAADAEADAELYKETALELPSQECSEREIMHHLLRTRFLLESVVRVVGRAPSRIPPVWSLPAVTDIGGSGVATVVCGAATTAGYGVTAVGGVVASWPLYSPFR